MGRQTSFTPDVAEKIAERLETGEPLAQICRDEGMPSRKTVYVWADERPEFAKRIAGARAKGFDAIAEQCLVIADNPTDGLEVITKADGGIEQRRVDMLGHRKLQIETRLKLLAKWDPKRYGEKVTVGGDPESPLALTVQFVKAQGVS